MSKNVRALLKALSSITANISAAWFGLAFVTPNFADLSNTDSLLVTARWGHTFSLER